ncbi:hypothetical protein H9L10_02540 [Phycicoccus endophyticus]|uniref:DUF559 domain-containing protein n=1 Tax=Phycicoccus endophyticus TaxID=1690220 RepID=A0A7G9R301_9MICO|nr:hypothetical protein [Phycicoccus endophyticus]NHI20269.1 hypothetical protein [Phycicoccus endophyticus]QNN49976.1 hypothetical protein H9L10_02540 [Phycicoccus endophyticus]GGL29133.1 hypothetical protein GCM10012283_09280 [Phycicoccus endophyticus]
MSETRPPPSWPFLRREAALLGVPVRALTGPRYRQVLPGVMVSALVPDTVAVRARAALLLAPEGAVVSHWTAARLWGGRVPDSEWVHVAFMRDVRFRVRGVRTHRHRHRLEVVRRHGVPVTSPGQTFCHLARFLGLVDLVALGDSLVRKHRLSTSDLVAYAEGWAGQCRGEALAAARLVREGVDSSPETALRLLMVLAGLPEPTVNVELRDADGHVRFRLDLGYEGPKVAVEYDGRWHDSPEQRAHDEARRAHLTDTEGWTFVLVTGDDLYVDPAALLDRLLSELRAAGVSVPSTLSDAWRAHFRVQRIAA